MIRRISSLLDRLAAAELRFRAWMVAPGPGQWGPGLFDFDPAPFGRGILWDRPGPTEHS